MKTATRKPAVVTMLQEGVLNNPDSPLAAQIKHEREASERGYSDRARKAAKVVQKGKGATLSPVQNFSRDWHEDMVKEIKRLRRTSPKDVADRLAVMVLRAVDPDLAAQVVLTNMLSEIARHPAGVPVQKIAKKIGADLEGVLKGKVIGEALREVAKNHKCTCEKCDPSAMVRRKGSCEKMKRMRGVRRLLGDKETNRVLRIAQQKNDMLPEELAWLSHKMFTTVGIKLVESTEAVNHIEGKTRQGQKTLIQAFEIDTQTIFVRDSEGKRVRKPRSVIPSDTLNRSIRNAIDRWCYKRPHYPPSFHPPFAWADPEAGGYMILRKGLIANGTRAQYAALEGADLSVVFAGLDAVQSIPWQCSPKLVAVNRALARNELPALRKGRFDKAGKWVSAIDSIPPSDDPPMIVHPLIASGRFKSTKQIRKWYKTTEGEEWQKSEAGRQWAYKAIRFFDMLDELTGLRMVYALQIDEMERCADKKQIYFPHHIDFRGRAQPIPLYFSHHGPDFIRGSLRFAEPEVPTEDSAFWIKVALANHWGQGWESRPFEERIDFAEENAPMIEACAADPCKNLDWLKADEPFQFLSACIAIHDPEHAKRFVVWQDASANGLQHLSAAGRDPATAALVNLVKTNKKSSAYQVVEYEGRKLLAECATPETRYVLPRVRKDLDEKLIKQPVLSTPYNVTDRGRRDQMIEKLRKKGWRDDEAYDGVALLSSMVDKTMRKVAPGAMRILDWFITCTKRIVTPSKNHPLGRPLKIPSPSGLPVLQPYHNETSVRQRVNGHQFSLVRSDQTLPVNVDQQVNGCSANIVHDWDAANAADVAVRCMALSIRVPTIFDCFGSAPGSTRRVRGEWAESFIALHEKDQLAILAAYWRAEYPDVKIPDPPARGTFDLNHVRHATHALN